MNLLSVLLVAAATDAAAAPALRVEVDAAAAARLDVAEMTRALGDELEVDVVLDGAAPARVVVLAERGDIVVIRYEDDDGARRERSVALPGEPTESTRIVVLLVSNLARDQVGALAALADPADAPDPAETSVPVETVAVSPPAHVGPGPAPAPAPAEGAAPGPARPKRSPAERGFHFGLGVTGGAAAVDGAVTPFFIWGAELGWTVAPHLNIGMARISAGGGGSSDEPVSIYVHGTPYIELAGFIGTRLEPFARAGVLVRGKSENNDSPGWFEAAPYLGGGARFYVTPAVALGLDVGINVVVTDELTLGASRLPRWSVPGAVGVSTTFHF